MHKLTAEYFRMLHERGATIEERYGDSLAKGNVPDGLTLAQIDTWNANVSFSDKSMLAKRLKWFASENSILAEIHQKFIADSASLKGWVDGVKKILLHYKIESFHENFDRPYLQTNLPIPFEELLIPWIDFAVASSETDTEIFSEIAHNQLKRALLHDLSKHSALCFYEEFNRFRSSYSSNSDGAYDDFIKHFYADGSTAFWLKYAVLARLLNLTIDKWIVSKSLFFKRLANDKVEIENHFFNGKNIGEIQNIATNLSTPHSMDGQVMLIHFESGEQLLYKPRSGAPDVALIKIITWFNEQSPLLDLAYANIIDKKSYSWQEYVPNASCKTPLEVEHYHQRIGQLAGLLFNLGSTDIHFGNLRANGAYPILTDNETLFSASVKVIEGATLSGDKYLDESILQSITQTQFLIDATRLFYPNSSSIVGAFEDEDRHFANRFSKINTGKMNARKVKVIRKGANLAKLNQKKSNPIEHIKQIKLGFEQTSIFLSSRNLEFYQIVKSTTNSFNLRFRILIRSSPWYHALVFKSMSPKYLMNGVDRSIYFDKAAAFFLASSSQGEAKKLLTEEREMLDKNLIPWFHLRMKQLSYSEINTTHSSSFSIVKKSSKNIIEERNLGKNRDLIALRNQKILDYYLNFSSIPSAQKDDFVQMIENLYFCYSNLFSIDQETLDANNLLKYYYLEEGISGVILLFSAYYKAGGPQKFKVLSLELLQPLKSLLSDESAYKIYVRQANKGALKGIGSIITALTLVAKYLKEDGLMQMTKNLIQSTEIEWETEMSLSSGLAGFLFASLQWSEETGLKSCDDKLKEGLGILRKLKFTQLKMDSGFTTGLSGILHVITRLEIYFGMKKPASYLIEQANFVRFRLQSEWRSSNTSFCDGLAGWVIADSTIRNAGMPSILPITLNRTIHILARLTATDSDSIANGVMGKVEALLHLDVPIEFLSGKILKGFEVKYEKSGKFNVAPQNLNPFFYKGSSGILYQYLRLKHGQNILSLWR